MLARGFLLILISVAFSAPATAADTCYGCTEPCNEHWQCTATTVPGGVFNPCINTKNCTGCSGWFCESGIAATAVLDAKPLQARYTLVSVTVENRARVTPAVRIAGHLPAPEEACR
jgi:hypothetical protein